MIDFDNYEVVTFDCYGTLIDWEAGILAALRPVLAAHGVCMSDDVILENYARLEAAAEAGVYRPYALLLRSVMQQLGQQLGFKPGDTQLSALPQSIKDWPPFADTIASLERLKSKYQLAIISNIDDDLFEGSAKQLRVPFDQIVTAQQAGAYKPSLDTFNFALDKIGVARDRVLHVAQSLYHDIAPARELKLSNVWVNRRKHTAGWGATPASDATPDLEVASLGELADRAGL